jgi:hypothetical protein
MHARAIALEIQIPRPGVLCGPNTCARLQCTAVPSDTDASQTPALTAEIDDMEWEDAQVSNCVCVYPTAARALARTCVCDCVRARVHLHVYVSASVLVCSCARARASVYVVWVCLHAAHKCMHARACVHARVTRRTHY